MKRRPGARGDDRLLVDIVSVTITCGDKGQTCTSMQYQPECYRLNTENGGSACVSESVWNEKSVGDQFSK